MSAIVRHSDMKRELTIAILFTTILLGGCVSHPDPSDAPVHVVISGEAERIRGKPNCFVSVCISQVNTRGQTNTLAQPALITLPDQSITLNLAEGYFRRPSDPKGFLVCDFSQDGSRVHAEASFTHPTRLAEKTVQCTFEIRDVEANKMLDTYFQKAADDLLNNGQH